MSQQYPQDPNAPQQPYYPAGGPPPYQGPPPPGWQPPKKKHTVRNVFIVLGVLAFLGIGGCMAIVGVVGSSVDKQANTTHSVIYKVTGTAGLALITYNTDGSTTQEQANNAPVPWASSTLSIKGLVRIYQVSAQNMSGNAGSITCEIWEDGQLVKTATATGEASIASCDYTPQ